MMSSVIPNKENSLFRTGMKTSSNFVAEADVIEAKKTEKQYKDLNDEMDRMNANKDKT